jgi:hypothetical protein
MLVLMNSMCMTHDSTIGFGSTFTSSMKRATGPKASGTERSRSSA